MAIELCIILFFANMALSKPKNMNLSVALTERYFNLVFQKYGIAFSEDALCKFISKVPSLNAPGHTHRRF